MLIATIWIALVLFVAAEAGKARLAGGARPATWARPAWIIGALLAITHALLALATRYGWDHETAVRETARQGAALYGFEWRGSLYVNYLFLGLWLVAAWSWRTWVWRAFVLMMVANGAIVFARPMARPFGVLLVGALLWIWWPIGAYPLKR